MHMDTEVIVPYDQAQAIIPLLKEFSTGFDGGTDGTTTTYRVFFLDTSKLVLALLQARREIAFLKASGFPNIVVGDRPARPPRRGD